MVSWGYFISASKCISWYRGYAKLKENIPIIILMSFRLENAKTRYDITEREALAVVRCLAKVRWLVIGSKYLTNVYKDCLALESIFTQGSDAYGKISCWINRLTEYDYEEHHRPCKSNIMQIGGGIFCFHAKYSQSAIAIDLARMVPAVALIYSRLPIFSILLSDRLLLKSTHQEYQMSNWYCKIIFFFLDGPTALVNLSSTEKRAVKQASIKYRVTDQPLFYIEIGGETAKFPLPYEILSILR